MGFLGTGGGGAGLRRMSVLALAADLVGAWGCCAGCWGLVVWIRGLSLRVVAKLPGVLELPGALNGGGSARRVGVPSEG